MALRPGQPEVSRARRQCDSPCRATTSNYPKSITSLMGTPENAMLILTSIGRMSRAVSLKQYNHYLHETALKDWVTFNASLK